MAKVMLVVGSLCLVGLSISSPAEICSDDALLIQRRAQRTLGIGKSQRALKLLQITDEMLPRKSAPVPSFPSLDVALLLEQADVLKGNETTHLTNIDKEELVAVKEVIRRRLRDNLKNMSNEDKEEVVGDFDDLVSCGTNKTSDLDSLEKNIFASLLNMSWMHKTCRIGQGGLNSVNDSRYATYSEMKTRIDPLIQSSCDSTSGFNKDKTSYIVSLNKWATEYNAKHEAYTLAHQDARDKRKTCDTKQGEFERGFCAGKTSLTTSCSKYVTCYTTRLAKYKETKVRVSSAVLQRRDFLKSSEAIICHLDVILGVGDGSHSECQSSTASYNTSAYDITYPQEPAKSECDLPGLAAETGLPLMLAPGHTDWSSTEYAGDGWPKNIHLADVQACAGGTTETAVTEGYAKRVKFGDESYDKVIDGEQSVGSHKSYYKTIDGVKYDRALFSEAEDAAKDGQISEAEAQRLWDAAMDGKGVTDIEKETLRYALKTYGFTGAAKVLLEGKLAA